MVYELTERQLHEDVFVKHIQPLMMDMMNIVMSDKIKGDPKNKAYIRDVVYMVYNSCVQTHAYEVFDRVPKTHHASWKALMEKSVCPGMIDVVNRILEEERKKDQDMDDDL